jgi:hypothetical protein
MERPFLPKRTDRGFERSPGRIAELLSLLHVELRRLAIATGLGFVVLVIAPAYRWFSEEAAITTPAL